jgi:hypothetical protein
MKPTFSGWREASEPGHCDSSDEDRDSDCEFVQRHVGAPVRREKSGTLSVIKLPRDDADLTLPDLNCAEG